MNPTLTLWLAVLIYFFSFNRGAVFGIEVEKHKDHDKEKRYPNIPDRILSDNDHEDDEKLDDDDDDEDEEEEDDDDKVDEKETEAFDEDKAWLVHGALMSMSWGLLAPLAIGSSFLRKLVGDTWFKIHFYTQVLVFILSTIGVGLAILNVQFDDDEHFDETHKAVGMAIYILLLIQVCSGLFRPHAPGHPPTQSEHHDNESEIQVDGDTDDTGIAICDQRCSSVSAAPTTPLPEKIATKTSARLFFEIQHRILGAALVGLAWFNCSTGIRELFDEGNSSPFLISFWAVAGGIAIAVGFLRLTCVQFQKKM